MDSSNNMATQCPYCATVFQMTGAQLREHGHQVRCGRCYAVFSAIRNMLDYGATEVATTFQNGSASGVAPSVPGGTSPFDAELPFVGVGARRGGEAGYDPDRNMHERSFLDTQHPSVGDTPTVNLGDYGTGEQAREVLNLEQEMPPGHLGPASAELRAGPAAPPSPPSTAASQASLMQSFSPSAVLGDKPRSMWPGQEEKPREVETSPFFSANGEHSMPEAFPAPSGFMQPGAGVEGRLRGIFVALLVVLLVVLFGQMLYTYRVALAQSVPSLHPVLKGFCYVMGCSLGPPYGLEQLSIESTQLNQDPFKLKDLELQVTLRNQGGEALAWPSLKLQLKNQIGDDELVKVFPPSSFLVSEQIDVGIEARSRQTIQIRFAVDGIDASNYTVNLLY